MLNANDDAKKILEYIKDNIQDIDNPVIKTIGYYLNDHEAVNELKDYFNSKKINRYFIFIVLIDIFLIFNFIQLVKMPYLSFYLKTILFIGLVYIGSKINRIYHSFVKESYHYHLIYMMLERVPKEKLEVLYQQVKQQKVSDN